MSCFVRNREESLMTLALIWYSKYINVTLLSSQTADRKLKAAMQYKIIILKKASFFILEAMSSCQTNCDIALWFD